METHSKFIAFGLLLLNFATIMDAVGFGKCPKYTPQKEFSIKQFEGIWYPAAGYKSHFGHCQQLNFTATSDFTMNATLKHKADRNVYVEFEAKAITPHINTPGYLYWSWTPAVVEEFTVLDTNYTNYALIYSCYDFFLFHKAGLTLLSRNQNTDYYNYNYTVLDEYTFDDWTEQANEILWNVGYKENAWWHRFYRCDFTSSHKKTYNIQGALKEVRNVLSKYLPV